MQSIRPKLVYDIKSLHSPNPGHWKFYHHFTERKTEAQNDKEMWTQIYGWLGVRVWTLHHGSHGFLSVCQHLSTFHGPRWCPVAFQSPKPPSMLSSSPLSPFNSLSTLLSPNNSLPISPDRCLTRQPSYPVRPHFTVTPTPLAVPTVVFQVIIYIVTS